MNPSDFTRHYLKSGLKLAIFIRRVSHGCVVEKWAPSADSSS